MLNVQTYVKTFVSIRVSKHMLLDPQWTASLLIREATEQLMYKGALARVPH